MRMKAGTRMPRTIVASMSTASAIAKPSDLMTMTDDSANAPKTATMISAAPVMIPPVIANALRDRPGVVAVHEVALTDAGEEQHLVVHRQSEEDREHQDRRGGDDRPRRVEVEQPGEVALLEDPDQRAEAGRDRQQAHEHRLDRQEDRSEGQEQDDRR